MILKRQRSFFQLAMIEAEFSSNTYHEFVPGLLLRFPARLNQRMFYESTKVTWAIVQEMYLDTVDAIIKGKQTDVLREWEERTKKALSPIGEGRVKYDEEGVRWIRGDDVTSLFDRDFVAWRKVLTEYSNKHR